MLHSRGDPISANRHYSIYIHPNEGEDVSICEGDVKDGLIDYCDQIYNYAVGYYEIYLNEGACPNLNDGDKDEHYNEFKTWCSQYYDNYAGMHLGIDNDYSGGVASGDGSGNTSFSVARYGVAGASIPGSETAATAIHEAIHPTVNSALPEVDDMISHFADEHELGRVDSNSVSSPMVNNYGVTKGQYGSCNSYHDEDSQSTDMTPCEIDAVKYTADDEF